MMRMIWQTVTPFEYQVSPERVLTSLYRSAGRSGMSSKARASSVGASSGGSFSGRRLIIGDGSSSSDSRSSSTCIHAIRAGMRRKDSVESWHDVARGR